MYMINRTLFFAPLQSEHLHITINYCITISMIISTIHHLNLSFAPSAMGICIYHHQPLHQHLHVHQHHRLHQH